MDKALQTNIICKTNISLIQTFGWSSPEEKKNTKFILYIKFVIPFGKK